MHPFKQKIEWHDSRLFGSAPDNVIEILQSEPVTANFHSLCVTNQVSST